MSCNTLVLGTAIGYSPDQLSPFVVSLRKYYQGRVALLVKDVTEELETFFKKYNIEYYVLQLENRKFRPIEIFDIRHREYLNLMGTAFVNCDRIFLTDVRDVYFQADPFSHIATTELEFFLEPMLIKNCEFNTSTILESYGEEVVNQLGDQHIICAGTTMGSRTGIITYLTEMVNELARLRMLKDKFVMDQASHNYLIYTDRFPNHKKYHTNDGPVATLHHMRAVIFDNNGNLTNSDGSVIAIVHQWDRLSKDHRAQILTKILS